MEFDLHIQSRQLERCRLSVPSTTNGVGFGVIPVQSQLARPVNAPRLRVILGVAKTLVSEQACKCPAEFDNLQTVSRTYDLRVVDCVQP